MWPHGSETPIARMRWRLELDAQDVALLAFSGFVAITALARVMMAYQRRLMAQARDEAEAEVQRRRQGGEGERAEAA